MVDFAEGQQAPREEDRHEFLKERSRKAGKFSNNFFKYLKKPVREVPPPPAWMVKPAKPPGVMA